MTSSTPATPPAAVRIPAEGRYRLDPARSTVSFTTRHMFGLGKVRGTFALREGHVDVADPVEGSSARAVVAATAFDTGNATRDTTVRSGQYLDAENHPDIVFVSTGLTDQDGVWVLRGSLTVRGSSRPVEVHLRRAAAEGERLRLLASSRIDRYDFGITAMKGMTGRYLDVVLDLVAERA
ncbi:YceI family protein [Prauserella muralis]|uniref:Uncharacterized protein n=1 Tax=Prauserella muralis TaxID=588067 RepID=A0A2V4APV0_9PSEU|nr:YceI family protein [Prauserella muralis]PXY22607.1 hypothetical protein BAY60_22550 [Prauserella muralis]TWE28311.1 polyisoprenoid-binding protein YceI [Prauserella muralis]